MWVNPCSTLRTWSNSPAVNFPREDPNRAEGFRRLPHVSARLRCEPRREPRGCVQDRPLCNRRLLFAHFGEEHCLHIDVIFTDGWAFAGGGCQNLLFGGRQIDHSETDTHLTAPNFRRAQAGDLPTANILDETRPSRRFSGPTAARNEN